MRCWPSGMIATSFPASTKDSARGGLRSCHSQRSSSAVASLPREAEVRADAALIKGLMRRTEDVITIGQARLVAATLLARDPAAVPFNRRSLYAAALSWADGDTTWADANCGVGVEPLATVPIVTVPIVAVFAVPPDLNIDALGHLDGLDRSDERGSRQHSCGCRNGKSDLHHVGVLPCLFRGATGTSAEGSTAAIRRRPGSRRETIWSLTSPLVKRIGGSKKFCLTPKRLLQQYLPTSDSRS